MFELRVRGAEATFQALTTCVVLEKRGELIAVDLVLGHVLQHQRPLDQDSPRLAELMPCLTPLDPARSSRDLLEDLLHGIRGCHLLYRECADYTDHDPEDGIVADEEDAVDTEFPRHAEGGSQLPSRPKSSSRREGVPKHTVGSSTF
jgi:hypothetical protein